MVRCVFPWLVWYGLVGVVHASDDLTVAATAPAAVSVPATPATPAARAGVSGFSPSGEATHGRQVTVRFATPMVALGDPRLADPFDINSSASLSRSATRDAWSTD